MNLPVIFSSFKYLEMKITEASQVNKTQSISDSKTASYSFTIVWFALQANEDATNQHT